MSTSASRPHLWLEGQGDRALLDAILRHHGIVMPPDSYKVTNGSDELLRSVPLDVRGHPVIGIVIDADQPEDNNWRRLCDALRAEGVEVPEQPSAGGLVLPGPRANSRVGVWLMPDNRGSGMLEDFIRELMPERTHDPVWQLAERATAEAGSAGEALGVAVGPDEAIFVAGQVHKMSQLGNVFGGRYNPEGEPLWAHFYDNPDIHLDDSGEAAAFGLGFVVIAGSETVLGEGSNVWVRRLDLN